MSESRRIRKDPTHPSNNIERARRLRAKRISCGIRVRADFSEVEGVLLVSQGCGKWTKPAIYRTVEVPVSPVLADQCREFQSSQNDSLSQLLNLRADLAEIQSETVRHLLSGSVKALDRVLVVAVEDPGVWRKDFDGKTNYLPLTAPSTIAEKTGLTVVDAFPQNDVEVGGSGKNLNALLHWILFANREPKVSCRTKVFIAMEDFTRIAILPPSDGLEAEVPAIRFRILPGMSWLGKVISELQTSGQAQNAYENPPSDSEGEINESMLREISNLQKHETPEAFVSKTAKIVTKQNLRPSDIRKTLSAFIAHRVIDFVEQATNKEDGFESVILSGSMSRCETIRSVLKMFFTESKLQSVADFGFHERHLNVVTTAMMGLMHIDQFPINIPWITGATASRVLGRLTPGSPSNWQSVISEMSEYRPSRMTLREAVTRPS